MSWPPPPFLREAIKDVIEVTEVSHYANAKGRARLRQALSKAISPSYKLEGGRELNPETEILITAGANEGERRSVLATSKALDIYSHRTHRHVCCCGCFPAGLR
jgi:aspartate/methionine/tyrosine aminotransferase